MGPSKRDRAHAHTHGGKADLYSAVQRGDIVIRTDIGGRVVPANSKPVRFATDGEVQNVYVQVGDYVTEGQLLADQAVFKELETEWARVSTQARYEEVTSGG